jgi:hypothetical protein
LLALSRPPACCPYLVRPLAGPSRPSPLAGRSARRPARPLAGRTASCLHPPPRPPTLLRPPPPRQPQPDSLAARRRRGARCAAGRLGALVGADAIDQRGAAYLCWSALQLFNCRIPIRPNLIIEVLRFIFTSTFSQQRSAPKNGRFYRRLRAPSPARQPASSTALHQRARPQPTDIECAYPEDLHARLPDPVVGQGRGAGHQSGVGWIRAGLPHRGQSNEAACGRAPAPSTHWRFGHCESGSGPQACLCGWPWAVGPGEARRRQGTVRRLPGRGEADRLFIMVCLIRGAPKAIRSLLCRCGLR